MSDLTASQWVTEEWPDFTQHGFHTGRKVLFQLSDGREIEDIYQGWGIFGTGDGYIWMAGDPRVTAWRPVTRQEPAP